MPISTLSIFRSCSGFALRLQSLCLQYSKFYVELHACSNISVVAVVSLLAGTLSLIVTAFLVLIAASFYSLSSIKSQDFISSKRLGGQGLVQMIV
jgi:hypothetical protein